MHAVRIHKTGDVDVLQYEEVPLPVPKDNEVLIKIHYAGVNFIDTYHRSGLYKVNLPFILGSDGSGEVVQVGKDVKHVKVGERVAFFHGQTYAEYVAVPEEKVVQVPEGVGLDVATALMVQGMTAHYLATDSYPIKQGDTVLIHAAAGGTGQLLTQIAKIRGARVIGTVGSQDKVELAKSVGADDVILYREKDIVEEVRRLTNGEGVAAVYDGIGKDTWEKSLDSLKVRGTCVFFGNASGPVPKIDPLILTQKGSIYITRPSLMHFTRTREETLGRTNELFNWMKDGKLKVKIHKIFDLKDARLAHKEIQAAKTTGKILLKSNVRQVIKPRTDPNPVPVYFCTSHDSVSLVNNDLGLVIEKIITHLYHPFCYFITKSGIVYEIKGKKLNEKPQIFEKLKHYRVKHFSLGRHHFVAITNDGSVLTWGEGHYGKLGYVPQSSVPKPVTFFDELTKKGIYPIYCAAGYHHTFVCTSDLKTYGFGYSENIGCGNRVNHGTVLNPTELEHLRGEEILKICTFEIVLALTKSGKLYGWGYNDCGGCGVGNNSRIIPEPRRVKCDEIIVDMSAATAHVVFCTKNMNVYVIGEGFNGCLLRYENTNIPKQLFEMTGYQIVKCATSSTSSIFITSNGKVLYGGSLFTEQWSNKLRYLPIPNHLHVSSVHVGDGFIVLEPLLKKSYLTMEHVEKCVKFCDTEFFFNE